MSLGTFAAKVPRMTEEDVLAPEFLITQGLRFTFEVRHPFRGLEGGFMELIALADGKGRSLGLNDSFMMNLPPLSSRSRSTSAMVVSMATSTELKDRIMTAHTAARELLKTSVQLTDAYFLYTPSQIWLAALYVVDEQLARAYLDSKFSPALTGAVRQDQHHKGEREEEVEEGKVINRGEFKMRLTSTIHRLATLLRTADVDGEVSNPTGPHLAELKRIDKKLYHCRNPERTDLMALNRSLRDKPSTSRSTTTPKCGGTKKSLSEDTSIGNQALVGQGFLGGGNASVGDDDDVFRE